MLLGEVSVNGLTFKSQDFFCEPLYMVRTCSTGMGWHLAEPGEMKMRDVVFLYYSVLVYVIVYICIVCVYDAARLAWAMMTRAEGARLGVAAPATLRRTRPVATAS